MIQDFEIWDGLAPRPEGPTLMGCAWLRDHFTAAYSRLDRLEDNVGGIIPLIVTFSIIQMLFNVVICGLLWRILGH